jgi:hypothetical protein
MTTKSIAFEKLKIMGHPQQMGKDENYPANLGYPGIKHSSKWIFGGGSFQTLIINSLYNGLFYIYKPLSFGRKRAARIAC